MMYAIKTTAGRLAPISPEQLRQEKKNVVVSSRNPGKVAGLANRDAQVLYLGPWGSATAYLVERAA